MRAILNAIGLIGADRRTERLALLGVLHTFVDAALRGADRQRGDGDAALVEDAQEVGVAAAALTEQVLRRAPGRRRSSADGCPRRSSRPCCRRARR